MRSDRWLPYVCAGSLVHGSFDIQRGVNLAGPLMDDFF